ncbi:YuzL family protein [Bacillus licheniformis]|nr:YuzL family protein [Bacillus licheniformis]
MGAASSKSNAKPVSIHATAGGKRTSQNQQYKKHNMDVPEDH